VVLPPTVDSVDSARRVISAAAEAHGVAASIVGDAVVLHFPSIGRGYGVSYRFEGPLAPQEQQLALEGLLTRRGVWLYAIAVGILVLAVVGGIIGRVTALEHLRAAPNGPPPVETIWVPGMMLIARILFAAVALAAARQQGRLIRAVLADAAAVGGAPTAPADPDAVEVVAGGGDLSKPLAAAPGMKRQ
jgi:hypothetical protein